MAARVDETPIWERFINSKLTAEHGRTQGTQSTQQGSILDSRSVNLTAGSMALHAGAGTAVLMRELAERPVAEIFSQEASKELANRNRYVEFVEIVMKCSVADASGREKKADVAVRAIQAMHTGLVVDRSAKNLQDVLLGKLDDIDPDRVPLIVETILSPLLAASRRGGAALMIGGRAQPPGRNMSETAAVGFLTSLEVLPKALGLTAGVAALGHGAVVPEGVRGLSGAEYKQRVVSRLFRARWPGAVSVGMCQVLRDLDLDEGQLKVAVGRVLRHLRKNAKLHDLPALTYQLLLLAGRGCKEAALEGVIRVFDRLDAAAEAADREDSAAADGHIPIRRSGRLCASSTEELRLVEGTILLHFNFAMKQDHNLASCLLKGFQRRVAAPEVDRAFTPFRVALLLSMARIQRFSQPVLDLVQDIVTNCLVYDHLREESAWLEAEEDLARGIRRNGGGGSSGGAARSRADADNGGSDGEGGAAGGGTSCSSARVVERVLLTVVRSSRGWDHLVESLLKLGLQLLDRGGAGAGGGGVPSPATGAVKGVLERLQGSQSQRASLRASSLGRVILMETFKTHEIVRRQVLTSVLEQVTARSQGVMGYVKLLGLLSERNPTLLLDDAEAVRDVFGYISVLPPPVAEQFLLAVAPLLRMRPRLQDSVVLPLRKALFSREERARLVAVGGLVLLLGIQSGSSEGDASSRGEVHGGTQLSQTSQSQMSMGMAAVSLPVAAGMGGGGCPLSLAEGFGLLRRCLTQQLVVRAKLYDGLLASFGRGSFEFQLDTISLLSGHLRRYLNLPASEGATGTTGGGGGAGQPLLLRRCLDPNTGDIVEPLPLLIGCLHRMLVSGRESLAEHARNNSNGVRAEPDSLLDDEFAEDRGDAVREEMAAAAAEPLRESLDELDRDLRRLSAAVSSAAPEEFGLDKVGDFSPTGGPAARADLATAALLCGAYEALMQGSLILCSDGPTSAATRVSGSAGGLPASSAVRALLKLFDCRQTLLELVRPALPTNSQQRSKKTAVGGSKSSGSLGGSLGGDEESAGGAGGISGAGVGAPGFSAAGCFALTLYAGGMPCLGMTFVENMLAVLNVDAAGEGGDEAEETEGDTERDVGVVDVDAEEPTTQAVREDLGLQRLVLETCRGHLRTLRVSTAAASAGLSVEVGGGLSAKGAVGASSASGDEADATRAGKAAAKRCTMLAPLLLKEVFRQLTEGNTSGAAKEAADAAKANSSKGTNGKGKSGGGGGGAGGGDKGKRKTTRSATAAESPAEVALACLEECVCITAHCSPRARTRSSRTAKFLAAAYKEVPDSNVPPAVAAGDSVAMSLLGRHTGALVQTLTNLVADGQTKEAETVCRILSQLTRLLRLEPACLEAHASSLKLVCKDQRVDSPVLAKALLALFVQANMSMQTKDGHIDAIQDLTKQVRACVGLLDEDDEDGKEPPEATPFRVMNNYTITPISEVTVKTIEACIDDVEYALRLLQKAAVARQARVAGQKPGGLCRAVRNEGVGGASQSSGTVSEDDLSSDDSLDSDRNSDSDSDAGGVRRDGRSGERDPLDRRETLVCDRLQKVIQAMTVLVGARLERKSIERLVSSASRVFKAITKVLKVRLTLKRAYVGLGLKNVLASKKAFTKALQSLLPTLEGEKGSKVTKHNISRQSRLVPELIFQVEDCDVHLLKLSKLCKGSLDLSKWVTHRVDRDFIIDPKIIAKCQEQKLRELHDKNKRKDKGNKGLASKRKKSNVQQATSQQNSMDDSEEEEEEEEAGVSGAAGDEGEGDEEDGEDESGEE